jgi:A/G-specific adenine glycosylase
MSMNHINRKNAISEVLIKWYEHNKRDLPWRDITDPYKIWVSEIILQQTRVAQGIEYYFRFIQKFPNVKSLAAATEDEVLKLWQGLGYYSRARNMRIAASQIITHHAGNFPENYKDVLKLKGVGEYTAAAICSITFNEPFAVVDGNVIRVLSRLYGVENAVDTTTGIKKIYTLANEILDKKNPGLHNQALMEFGALMCVPTTPDCSNCVLKSICVAFQTNVVNLLPFKSKKINVKSRYFNYLYLKSGENIYIQKREAKDVWHNLYEFPLVEADKIFYKEELAANKSFKDLISNFKMIRVGFATKTLKHQLSHQTIYACLFEIILPETDIQFDNYIRIKKHEISNYPVSRLIELLMIEMVKQKTPE